MPSCEDILDHIKATYAIGYAARPAAENAFATAMSYWMSGDDHLSLYYLMSGVSHLKKLVYNLYVANYPSVGDFGVPYYLENCAGGDPPEDYELTWLKVIEAYIGANDDHRSGWQLLVDAYQASMYDKPFDLEYHTMWVQRFKSWA